MSGVHVVSVGIYACVYIYVPLCGLYISIWYMYIQFIFVLNNQCDNEKQVKTS